MTSSTALLTDQQAHIRALEDAETILRQVRAPQRCLAAIDRAISEAEREERYIQAEGKAA